MSTAYFPDPVERLSVSLLTGFLGSGKTTLLSRLLRHPGMDRTAVVINEFGEVGLDDALVETAEDDTVLLQSGCLCCTVKGDLVDALKRLFFRRAKQEVPEFKRVVIETTGLADPAPILHTLTIDPLLSSLYRLDGVVTTVDAVHAMGQLDREPESVKQAAVADRIVMTKTDLAEPAAVRALEARLRRLNPAAPIIPVVMGEVDPARLFDAGLWDPRTKSADVVRWLAEEAYRASEGHVYHRPGEDGHHGHHDHHGHGGHGGHGDHGDHPHGHGGGHDGPQDRHHGHDPNRHDDHVRAFTLSLEGPLPWETVAGALDLLVQTHGASLLRLKGVLDVKESEKPVVVHAVQHVFHPPAQIERWPDSWTGERRSRLVVIARDLDKATVESALRGYLAAMGA